MSRVWWAEPADQRRATSRTWTVRGVLTGVAAGVVVVVAATVGATSPHISETMDAQHGTSARPSVRALALGCGPTQFVTEPQSEVGWVDYDGELAYWPAVPINGWFAADPARADDLDATPEQVLHAMWFGERVIWVAADAPAGTTATLTALVEANPSWDATVRTWPAGRIEQLETDYAIAAWGVTQSCGTPDGQLIGELFAAAPVAPGADGTRPPAALNSSADST